MRAFSLYSVFAINTGASLFKIIIFISEQLHNRQQISYTLSLGLNCGVYCEWVKRSGRVDVV